MQKPSRPDGMRAGDRIPSEDTYLVEEADAYMDYCEQRITELEDDNRRLRVALDMAMRVGLPPHDVSGCDMWKRARAALKE